MSRPLYGGLNPRLGKAGFGRILKKKLLFPSFVKKLFLPLQEQLIKAWHISPTDKLTSKNNIL